MKEHMITLPRKELEELERKAKKLDESIVLERHPETPFDTSRVSVTFKNLVPIDDENPPKYVHLESNGKTYYYKLN